MSNKLFTIRLKAINLSALLIALLSTIVSAQATSPGPASANPQASPVLKLDSQGFEFLKTKRALAETAKDLTDPVRKQVIEQWDRAISFIKEKDRLEAEIQSYTRQVQQAPSRIKDIKSELGQKGPSFDKETELAGASDMPLEAIEQRVREGKAALAVAQGSLNSRQDQLAKLKNRPPIMQKAIADAKTRIQKLKKKFEGIHSSDASKALDESRQAVLITEQTKLQTSIRFYEQALLNHEVLLSLLTAELDLANYEVTILEAKTKALVEFAQKGRKLEASSARMDAEVAKKTAPDLPKAIKEQYDINIALGKDLEEVTTDEARAERTLDRRQSELKLLERDFEQARQLLQSDYLSESMGLSLRRYRQNLPDPDSYLKDSGKRQLTISQLSEAQFNLDDKRRGQLDIQEETRQILQTVGDVAEKNRARLEDTIRTLLSDRRDLFDKLQSNYRRYYKTLQSIEFTEKQLTTLTKEYTDFLDGNMLWIRSSRIIGPKDLKAIPSAFFWILAPRNWFLVLKDLLESFTYMPMLWIPGLALVIALFLGRSRSKQHLSEIAKNVGRVKKDSFMLTVRALGLTLYISFKWPFLLALVGFGLKTLPFAGSFSQAVSSGMITAAGSWAVLAFLYHLCREGGVSQVHFRWPEWSRLYLRRNLPSYTTILVLLSLFVSTIESATIMKYSDSLGRLLFLAWALLIMVFIVRFLKAYRNTLSASKTGGTEDRFHQFRFLWYPVALALPVLLAMLAVFGYYYSALVLVPNFGATIRLTFVLIVVNSLALRWLYIAQRRLAYEQAVARRMERLKAEQAKQDAQLPGDVGSTIEALEIEEPEISRDQINEQTRALLRILLIFSAVIGLWAIWNDVLPALNILEGVRLWSYSTEIEGVTRVMPITLKSALIAVIAAVITFVTARNLPGVLEITLLKYLPLDAGARYAFSTICRYVTTTIGVIVTFKYVGMNWAKLQWLVAALSVGLGFGLQEIVANFVSGLIILFERPIRIGDLVTVDNVDGTVTRIRIRATTITNWDRKEYLVPNKEFITGRLMNWTLSNPLNRVVINVGVAYGSDTEKARETLLKVAHAQPFVLKDPAPLATFEGFGDNSLNFVLRAYLANFDNWVNNKTTIHMAIDKEFRKAGITIAFPQRDIHFDSGRPLEVRITRDRDETPKAGLQMEPSKA